MPRKGPTPTRTRKRGAVPFAEQLAGKDPQSLECRHFGTHAHVAYRIVVRTHVWVEFCWCPRPGCGVETVWEVRIRDGQRTLISPHHYPRGYGFVGVGRRTLGERAAIDKRYMQWVLANPQARSVEVFTEEQWRQVQKETAEA